MRTIFVFRTLRNSVLPSVRSTLTKETQVVGTIETSHEVRSKSPYRDIKFLPYFNNSGFVAIIDQLFFADPNSSVAP
jgi:hypothetical protein